MNETDPPARLVALRGMNKNLVKWRLGVFIYDLIWPSGEILASSKAESTLAMVKKNVSKSKRAGKVSGKERRAKSFTSKPRLF